MQSKARVHQAIADLAQSLSNPHDLDETLHALTRAACDSIAGVDYASVNLLHLDGHLETLGPTDALATELDQLQARLREGPCYEAAVRETQQISEDLGEDDRWPRYGKAAAALGIGSQMGLDLPTSGKGRATLNLYSKSTGPFEDAEMAELFASTAALALGFARTLDSLAAALESRTEIGKALGIVMERYQIDAERAFQFLVRVSQHTNTKVREVASTLVDDLEQTSGARPERRQSPS